MGVVRYINDYMGPKLELMWQSQEASVGSAIPGTVSSRVRVALTTSYIHKGDVTRESEEQ